ncbi:MAG: S8 family serine peptidase [Bacterioplanes sp.]|nr:S8 family serine peptidase [Bacterioplanes sp.]
MPNRFMKVLHVLTVVLVSLILSACLGEGGGLRIEPSKTFSISGTVDIVAGVVLDSDINDRFQDAVDNDSLTTAQPIPVNIATVQGFASAVAGRNVIDADAIEQNFYDAADPDDYYQVTLQQGQRVVLHVVDFEQGDLDLYLYNAQSDDRIDASNGVGEFKTLVIPSSGEYIINVHALSGISKYVLRFLPSDAESLAMTQGMDDFAVDQMLVQFQPGVARAQSTLLANAFVRSEAIAPGIELMHIQRPVLRSQQQTQGAIPSEHAQWYAKRQTLIDIKTLRQRSDVQVAEPNYVRRLLRVPNDPRYSWQWHYPAIQLPAAWDDTVGESEQSSEPVIVAVLDTGVFLQHEDLQGRLVTGRDFVSNDNCPNCSGPGDDPGDSDQLGQSSWHGTHVAGTIAAHSNNGIGVTGVSWGAKIMPIRVLGKDGVGFSSDIIQGVRYAAGLPNNSDTLPTRRADVINLSLGGTSSSTFEQNTYTAVANAGVIVVAAAGNENTSQRSYPAAYGNVLAVSATEFRNQRAYYSNYGSWIDLAAPGGDMRVDRNGDGQRDGIFSTFVDDLQGKTNRRSSYAFQQGTSMAAPHVAGVIALMKAVSPTLKSTDIYDMLEDELLTDNIGSSTFFGKGLINAQKAVQAARAHASGLPNAPAPIADNRIRLRANVNSLMFGSDMNSQKLVLRNDNSAVNVMSVEVSGPEWLRPHDDEADSSGLGTYTVTVNRNGLVSGLYSGTLIFTANEGQESASTLALQVTMQVGTAILTSDLSPQYVLLIDPNESNPEKATKQTVLVDHNGRYRFDNVPVGDYKVIVGSDIDVNGFICEYAETCGGYPYLGAEQILRVRNASLTGIDMTVRVVSTEATGSAAANDEAANDEAALARPQGYRRGEPRSNALPLSKQR